MFIGGARSGKSAAAERYASLLGTEVIYLATAEAGDAEMDERIRRHRLERPVEWPTIEAPLEVAAVLRGLPSGSTVLLDCLSMLVSNLLLAGGANAEADVDAEVAAVLDAARARELSLLVVTNEVGQGIVPAYALGRVYRDVLGRANQRVAASAVEVYLLVAGIPVELQRLAAAWARRSG